MSDNQVTRAKYKSSVKEPGVAGLLELSIERFVFVPNDPKSPAKLNVEFKMIKAHKFTKEGSKQALLNLNQDQGANYIFEFDSFADRDVCREFVANAIAFHTEAGKAIPEKSVVLLSNEQLSTGEMERRIKVLQENSELQELHKQFVSGGILTDAEFWATRKANDACSKVKDGFATLQTIPALKVRESEHPTFDEAREKMLEFARSIAAQAAELITFLNSIPSQKGRDGADVVEDQSLAMTTDTDDDDDDDEEESEETEGGSSDYGDSEEF